LSAMFGNIFSKNKTVLPPILCPNKIGLDKWCCLIKSFKSLLLTRFGIVFPDSEENIQSIIGKSNWERFKKLSENTI
jgi:hypothetical protein